jgi:pyrrolysine biosynthesis protein PylD
MTRLKTVDIANVAQGLDDYDTGLLAATGLTLRGIACHAAGIDEAEALALIKARKVCAVPMTCGEGLIGGFSEALCGIAAHLGFRASVAGRTDVAGLAEAFQQGADIVLTADDFSFIAINTGSGRVVDNAEATGRGFVAGLARMAGGLNNASVLVIGCGSVGGSAALALGRMGASVAVYDIREDRCRDLAIRASEVQGIALCIEKDLQGALRKYRTIIDATPEENLIDETFITPVTYIALPGVPSGLTPGARQRLKDRCLHDPLQIGVATMLLEAIQ